MNIIILITDITTLGGVERTSLLLGDELIKAGHKVKIISLFKRNKTIKFPLGRIDDITYITDKGYLLKEDSSNRIAGLFSIISILFKFRKTIYSQDPRSIYIAQCFLPSSLLWLFGKSGKAIVCDHFKYELYHKFICKIRDTIYSRFLQVITLTKEDYSKYSKVIPNVRVIPNMSPYNVTASADLTSKRIISVGRLTYQKGYDFLIKAISKCKNDIDGWSVHIYGDGELLSDLQQMASEYNVNDIVHFEGYSSDIESELLRSSIFILSSRFEGLPMALLEAMSKGLSIISFDCPEGPKALLENNSGMLVDKEDYEKLADSIVLMTQSLQIRQTYSVNAQDAIKKYSAENVVKLWISLFNDLNIL